MSTASDPLEAGADFINTRDVLERIEYLTFLDDVAGDEAEEWADEVEELKRLRKLVAEVGEEAENGVGLILDSYWKQYADNDADEFFGLDGTGASAYFDYEKFAREYQTDFTPVEFDGWTYWFRS